MGYFSTFVLLVSRSDLGASASSRAFLGFFESRNYEDYVLLGPKDGPELEWVKNSLECYSSLWASIF